LSTAVSVGEDTAGVELEGELVGLDGNGERVVGEGRLHGRGGVSGDVSPASGLHTSVVGGRVVAATVLGGVGVGSLRHGVVVLVVVEGEGSVTTIATEAKLNAINKLLLRKLVKSAISNAVVGFEGSHR